MKIFIIKLLIALLCVPAYPFIILGQYYERNSYLGSKVKFRTVNRDYWEDVWDALTYKKMKTIQGVYELKITKSPFKKRKLKG